MTVRFRVKEVYVTTVQAISTQDGKSWFNTDFPKGSIYAEDLHGELFVYDPQRLSPHNTTIDDLKILFSERDFYRDYWRHIPSDRKTPYTQSLLNADKIRLA